MLYSEALNAIRIEKVKYNSGFQPPATSEQLDEMRVQAQAELGVLPPVEYEAFLGETNGLSWDSLLVYATHRCPIVGKEDRYIQGFVETNKSFRRLGMLPDSLVFADDGVVLYVLNVPAARYDLVFRVSQSVVKSFDSFPALLFEAMHTRLGVAPS